jgi:tellurite resistance protein
MNNDFINFTIDTALLVMLADGEIDDREIDAIADTFTNQAEFKDISNLQSLLKDHLNQILKILKDEEKLKANFEIESLNNDQKITALEVAVKVAYADGEFADSEEAVIFKIMKWNGLDLDLIHNIKASVATSMCG